MFYVVINLVSIKHSIRHDPIVFVVINFLALPNMTLLLR